VTQFKSLIRKAGLPELRFHDLRHTSATLLLAQGVHPRIVQERLGHADISMTLNRYSHVTPDTQRSAADTLDAVFTRVLEQGAWKRVRANRVLRPAENLLFNKLIGRQFFETGIRETRQARVEMGRKSRSTSLSSSNSSSKVARSPLCQPCATFE
jgi:hypothetical protein